jgi:hypothetical protein
VRYLLLARRDEVWPPEDALPAQFRSRGRLRRTAALVAATLAAAVLPSTIESARGLAPLPPAPAGYWLVASDGGIFTFGDAAFHGSTGDVKLNKPITGMAATSSGQGYWLVASDGGMFSFGDASFHGSTGDVKLNKPIVGMTPTPSGAGYWLVASDGGIFSFGDAAFHGSTGDVKLNKPITGMAATPTGQGYWLVASDGGVFSFGDASFHGSAAAVGSADPIVAIRPSPTGKGYWQANAAGKVFAFGDAADYGSTGPVNVPVVSMAPSPTGAGYWLTGRDGGIFAFGDARFLGSTGAVQLNQPIVGMAPLPHRAAGTETSTTDPTSATTQPGDPGTGSTTTTTEPGPYQPASHPADPDGSAPEPVSEPFPKISGGTSYTEISPDPDVPHSSPAPWNVTPRSCGFPEMARVTQLPDDTDYIGEASGMAASRNYPGVYWVVRDSGHTPAINAIRIDSEGFVTTKEIFVDGATNGDWEEVNYTIGPDGKGRLWVVDNGGNASGGAKAIYQILEPDPDMAPTGTDGTRHNRPTYTVPFEKKFRWEYPDGNANTEAAFMHKGYLVVLTKTEPHARMYRFNTLDENVTNRPQPIGNLGGSKSISVARQSADGQYLVTASHELVRFYKSTDGSGSISSFANRLPDCEFKAFPDQHVESGEFSGPRQMHFITEIKRVIRLNFAG